ncbi:MAG: hypothetical protein LBR72_02100, partial [Oscillospiraceae bacterium]|nr:hypothetical protein [Oscillospiraceae bacterium]
MKTALADWCGAFSSAVIVTDEGQRVLAEAMDLPNCRIIPFGDDCLRTLQELRPDDLAVLLLSLDTFTRSGA